MNPDLSPSANDRAAKPSDAARGHRQAVAGLLLATAFWGTSFCLTKGLSEAQQRIQPSVSTIYLASSQLAWRFFLAGGLFLLWKGLKLVTRLTRREVVQALAFSLCAFGGMLLQMDGLNYTTASTSAFLTQAYCLFLPLLAAVRTRSRPHWTVVAATLAVIVGSAILSGFRWNNWQGGRGEIETLLATLFFTGQIQLLEEKVFQANDSSRVAFLTLLIAGALFGVTALLTGTGPSGEVWRQSGVAWWIVIFLAVFPTFASFLLMVRLQPRVPAVEAGIIYSLEPLFATALAFFLPGLLSIWLSLSYPNERLTAHLLIGGAFIFSANLLIQFQPRR